jgi:hypothetical protein
MAWGEGFGDVEPVGQDQSVELVGTHLRLTGTVRLGRFNRLTDLVNSSRGFVRFHDVRLLLPNGKPTDITMPELMIDQDEISFIAQHDAPEPEAGVAVGFIEPKYEATAAVRKPREYVLITHGHTISGKVHVFGQTDAAGFVDASDPHFIPVTDATTRSLADAKMVSVYQFVLVNRQQMIGASEVKGEEDVAPVEWPAEDVAPEALPEP